MKKIVMMKVRRGGQKSEYMKNMCLLCEKSGGAIYVIRNYIYILCVSNKY